jgi:hypothetical protein
VSLGQKERIHRREHWASTIVLMLAQEIQDIFRARETTVKEEKPSVEIAAGCSFVVWNKDNSAENKLDPNYLSSSQFKDSSFHQCLHKFV